jgi:hypothetical protein
MSTLDLGPVGNRSMGIPIDAKADVTRCSAP